MSLKSQEKNENHGEWEGRIIWSKTDPTSHPPTPTFLFTGAEGFLKKDALTLGHFYSLFILFLDGTVSFFKNLPRA